MSRALEKLVINPEDAIVIGDTIHDAVAAKSCSVPCILLSHEAEAEFDLSLFEDTYPLGPSWSISEFVNLLENI